MEGPLQAVMTSPVGAGPGPWAWCSRGWVGLYMHNWVEVPTLPRQGEVTLWSNRGSLNWDGSSRLAVPPPSSHVPILTLFCSLYLFIFFFFISSPLNSHIFWEAQVIKLFLVTAFIAKKLPPRDLVSSPQAYSLC